MASQIDSTPVVMTSEVGVWTGDDKDYSRVSKKKAIQTEDALLIDADQQSAGTLNTGYDYNEKDDEKNLTTDRESDGDKSENGDDQMAKSGGVKDNFESEEEESDVDTFL